MQTNPYTKNLNRPEFMMTLACTGRCIHCSEGEHLFYPNGSVLGGNINADDIAELTESCSPVGA